jgi:hypothetical protein
MAHPEESKQAADRPEETREMCDGGEIASISDGYGSPGGSVGGVGEFETARPRTMGAGEDPYSGPDDFRTSSAPPFEPQPNSNGRTRDELFRPGAEASEDE